jgi:hypothetical protein
LEGRTLGASTVSGAVEFGFICGSCAVTGQYTPRLDPITKANTNNKKYWFLLIAFSWFNWILIDDGI